MGNHKENRIVGYDDKTVSDYAEAGAASVLYKAISVNGGTQVQEYRSKN